MDNTKIGELIYKIRKEKNLTQQQLANKLYVSDKAISKWERGLGCPDVSLLPTLAEELGVTLENLLQGEVDPNDMVGGNMKKLKFYICSNCNNIITSTADVDVSCCGRKLKAGIPQKAPEDIKLNVERIEHDYYISSSHPMTKDNYISFVALLTGDSMMMRKQYPEWDLQTRIPNFGRGMLIWHSTEKGLFYQLTSK